MQCETCQVGQGEGRDAAVKVKGPRKGLTRSKSYKNKKKKGGKGNSKQSNMKKIFSNNRNEPMERKTIMKGRRWGEKRKGRPNKWGKTNERGAGRPVRCRRHVLTFTSVIAISTMLPTTIKASNVFHASQK